MTNLPCKPVQGRHARAGRRLGQSDAIPRREAHVRVMQEPVDGSGGECFGHELVETGRMHIRADGHRTFLIRRIHQTKESLGGIRTDGQEPDIVNDDQLGAQDGLHRFGHRIVGTVAAHQHSQLLQPEPRHFEAGFNGELTEAFQKERLAGARR